MKKYLLVVALMTVAACGAGEEIDTDVPAVTETTAQDDEMSDDEMSDDEMSDDEMSDDETDDEMSEDSSED